MMTTTILICDDDNDENCQSEPNLPLFVAPLRVTLSEFCEDLRPQKTGVPALSYSTVCVT